MSFSGFGPRLAIIHSRGCRTLFFRSSPFSGARRFSPLADGGNEAIRAFVSLDFAELIRQRTGKRTTEAVHETKEER
jgi:hypothetical protein